MSMILFIYYCRKGLKNKNNVLNYQWKGINMLELIFEFRKGIFFIRLVGDLNKESYQKVENELNQLIKNNKFKYVVINTNYLKTIDMTGINCITKICFLTIENKSNPVICDKYKIFKTLLNDNIPSITDELEVL